MSELLPSGTAAAQSRVITVASGTVSTLALKTATEVIPDGLAVDVQIRTHAGTFVTIGQLTAAEPAKTLNSPGTFRVSRGAVATAVGVDYWF